MVADDPFAPFSRHLLLEGGLVALGLAGALATSWRRKNLSRRSQSWPCVAGHVEMVVHETDTSRGSLVRPQIVDVTYSYVAAGERYTGTDTLSFRREDEAADTAGNLKDIDIQVRYNPSSPGESSPTYPARIRL